MPRKSKYERDGWNEKLELIQGWARDGLTDEQIAHNMGIGLTTLYSYKNKYPEFTEAIKKGKEVIDREVENALLKRALGYKYDEITQERVEDPLTGELKLKPVKVVTKEVHPDTTAQIFWLKNRKPMVWRDKKDIDVTSGGKDISGMSEEERKKRVQELRKKFGDD